MIRLSGAVSLHGFSYAVYDESFRAWTSELGSRAVRSDGTDPDYFPYDASRTYWPEGHVYSFFAAGCDAVEPGEGACSFIRDGENVALELFNPDHDRDFLAARALNRSKVSGVSMEFRHVGAKLSSLNIKPDAWLAWLDSRELGTVADLIITSVKISDAESQEYRFSRTGTALFTEESFDYGSSPDVVAGALSGCSAGLRTKGTSLPVNYHTFPGRHRLSISFHAVTYSGAAVLGEKTLSGYFTIGQGESASVDVTLDPVNDTLEISLAFDVAAWENGGAGQVYE